MRKAVRRLVLRPKMFAEPSGAETAAEWQSMLSRLEARDREAEQRLAHAEAALNKLTLT
jgi:hypothetical protein